MGLFSSTIGKLKKGLSATRDAIVAGVRDLPSLFRGSLDEQVINDIEARLLRADIGTETTRKLVDGLRIDYRAGKLTKGADALAYLKRELKALWPDEDRELRTAPPAPAQPTVILVAGINGSGKTTTISKLANMLRKEGKSVLLGACDTFRAGAVRQLEIWADRLNVDIIKGQQGGDPAAVAFDACDAAASRAVDVLILDTAGRLHTQDPLMRQLKKIRDVVAKRLPGAPHEVLLVLDATTGQNALRQASEFTQAISVSGIVLTKLDGTAKGGVVVAVRQALGVPVKFIGVGETLDDLEPFDPESFVEALFGEG
ncbi:MAG: signal recognition particle-docking protein FtsY [Phycisphaerales bacterium]